MEMREGFSAGMPMAEGTHRRVVWFAAVVLLVALLSPFVTARVSAGPPPPAGVGMTVQVVECRGPVSLANGVFNSGAFRTACLGVGGVRVEYSRGARPMGVGMTSNVGTAGFYNQPAGSNSVVTTNWAPAGPVMAACSWTNQYGTWFQGVPVSMWSGDNGQPVFSVFYNAVPNQQSTCYFYSTPALTPMVGR